VFRCLDQHRNNRDAKYWIEIVRPGLGEAVEYVKSLPSVEAAVRENLRTKELAEREQMRTKALAQREWLQTR